MASRDLTKWRGLPIANGQPSFTTILFTPDAVAYRLRTKLCGSFAERRDYPF